MYINQFTVSCLEAVTTTASYCPSSTLHLPPTLGHPHLQTDRSKNVNCARHSRLSCFKLCEQFILIYFVYLLTYLFSLLNDEENVNGIRG